MYRYRHLAFQPNQQAEVTAFRMAEQHCINPKDPSFKDYGGRGIEFRFKSFREFWDSVGPRPTGAGTSGKRSAYFLGRNDKNGHYEPGNVRWMLRQSEWSRGRNVPSGVPDKQIISFVIMHPDMTYEQVGTKLGCSGARVFHVIHSLGVRRRRGKHPETPDPGARFGKWIVISAERRSDGKWLCKCECGAERWVRSNNLKSGQSTNCGCAHNNNLSAAWTPEMRKAASERMKELHKEHPFRNFKRRRLTSDQAREIRRLWPAISYEKLSKTYGISPAAVAQIVKRKTYKDS